jgi:hypothetical protein
MRSLGAHKAGPGIPSARRLAWLAVLMMVAVAVLGPGAVGVAASRETGNNGTVKIHNGGGEPKSEVRNEPHVCTFHLHFFFADAGQSGKWHIEKWAPGPKGATVLSGSYMTDSKGEDRDPNYPGFYSLPNGHYKLFWNGDTDKHDKMKVFWVKCGEQGGGGETPTPPATPTPTPPGGGGGGQTPTPPPTPTPTPPGGGGGGGATPTPPHTPTPTPPGGGGGGGATPTPPGGGGGAGQTPTPPPGGGVEGATGTPNVSTTLPPTDTVAGTAQPAGDGWRTVLIGMAALLATILLLTPARVPARKLIRRR